MIYEDGRIIKMNRNDISYIHRNLSERHHGCGDRVVLISLAILRSNCLLAIVSSHVNGFCLLSAMGNSE